MGTSGQINLNLNIYFLFPYKALITVTVMGVATHHKKITEMKVATLVTPRPLTLVVAVGYCTSSNTATFPPPAVFLTTASYALG